MMSNTVSSESIEKILIMFDALSPEIHHES